MRREKEAENMRNDHPHTEKAGDREEDNRIEEEVRLPPVVPDDIVDIEQKDKESHRPELKYLH